MVRRTPVLKRRRYIREPKRRFTIYCEGGKTEPAYFTAMRRLYHGALVEIEPIAAVGVPYTVAQEASDRAEQIGIAPNVRRRRNSFEERDEVWAVFDRDTHANFSKAVALCESKNVGVARSDPCFELWLILHLEEYDKPDNGRAVQAYLRRLRPEYDPRRGKTPACDELLQHVVDAEERAELQLARREKEGSPFGRPSTTMFNLSRKIRTAANER